MSEFVPEGWKLKTIGELANVKRGASPRPINDSQWWGGNVGWVRISDVTSSNKYLNKTTQYLSDLGVSKSVKIDKGEVVLSICATIGKPIIVNVDACIHDGFVWFNKLEKTIHREFWYYFLLSNQEFLASQRQSGTQGNLNTSIVSDLLCYLPPLPEQQKIAAILTSVDEVIEKTQAQINKLKDLKTGMMQELLTRGVGVDGKPHTEFKDSPVGRIPKGWAVVPLEELVKNDKKITYGIVQAGPHYEGGVPYIRVSDMSSRHLTKKGMLLTSPEIARKFERSSVRAGDIVYALRGMIGHVHIVPSELNGANLTQGTARISPSENINTNYLLWAMRSPYVALQNDLEAKGSTFKEVTLASLRQIHIAVPSGREQQCISSSLSSIESRIYTTEDKLNHLKALKKALMQDLLTGKVRVKVDS
jgi:type I restriction enzyme S subunit